MPLFSKAQNSLRLENNTGHTVFTAYAIYQDNEKCWVSHGWYKVEAYKSFSVDLGSYNSGVYVHGEHQGLLTNLNWGKGTTLCVDNFKAFNIACTIGINCIGRKEFSFVNINDGENLFRFNP